MTLNQMTHNNSVTPTMTGKVVSAPLRSRLGKRPQPVNPCVTKHYHRIMTATLVVAIAALLPAMSHGGINGIQIDPPIAPPAGEINIECATVSAGVATSSQGMVFNVGQSVIGSAGNASVSALTGIVPCLIVPSGPPPIIPGDCDADGDVDLADYACYFVCESGVGGGVDPNCETYDFDLDDDVDLTDWGRFQVLFGSGL